MFQESQNQEYLNLCIERVKTVYLTWVEQVLDLIEQNTSFEKTRSLNDLGCNLGQFLKGLENRKLNIDYRGFDIDQTYLREARKIFQRSADRFHSFDLLEKAPPKADISVMSATLEHFEHFSPGLDHMLQSTNQLVLLRTFMGEQSIRGERLVKGAKRSYLVHQYSFSEVMDKFDEYQFEPQLVRDRFTDSLPKWIDRGLLRTHYIVVGRKRQS